MAKLLVIDKNRFQGIPFDLLIEFVKNYRVILPDVLCRWSDPRLCTTLN